MSVTILAGFGLGEVELAAQRPAKLINLWSEVKLPFDGSTRLQAIHFATATIGWIVVDYFPGRSLKTGQRFEIMKTEDAGANWRTLPARFSPEGSQLAKLFFLDAKAGWAVGSQDRLPAIWSSNDGGETWSANAWVASRFREVDPEGGVLLDVQFVDNRNGWAVGNFHGTPLLIATTDGGLSWRIQYLGREVCGQMSSIRFLDANHGMAVCSNGIFETSDGGTEWRLQHFDPGGLLNDLFVTTSDDAWAAGAWGQLFKRDKRRGWRALDVPAAREKFLAWITFSNPQIGWAAGPSGGVYVSRDGGGSWTRDEAPDAFLQGGDLIYVTSSKLFRIVAPNRLFVRPVDN